MPKTVLGLAGKRAKLQELIAEDSIERTGAAIGNNANVLSRVTGLDIRPGTWVHFTVSVRRNAAAVAAILGVRINATIVLSTATAGAPTFNGAPDGAVEQSGVLMGDFLVGEANYFEAGCFTWVLAQAAAAKVSAFPTVNLLGATASIPAANVTSIAILGDAVGALTLSSRYLRVWA